MLKKICFGLVILGMATQTMAYQVSPRQAIYHWASEGDILKLRQLQQVGFSIDELDNTNNTSLCEAVWRQDKTAVKSLMAVGADVGADCMHRIPVDYRENMGLSTGYIYDGTRATYDMYGSSDIPVRGSVYTSDSPYATAEPESSSAIDWVEIGITALAIGGGVAIATSGGSSHDSDDGNKTEDVETVCGGHGTQQKTDTGVVCQCEEGYAGETCESCIEGFLSFDGKCVREIICLHGVQDGENSCKCAEGYTGPTCASCVEGYESFGVEGFCYKKLACEHGTQHGNSCDCDEGWQGDDLCTTKTVCGADYVETCPTGYIATDTCKTGDITLNLCNTCDDGYTKIGEACVPEKDCGHGRQTAADHCTCDDGYAGDNCDTCALNYVNLNGACVAKIICYNGGEPTPENTCSCQVGYAGTNCDICDTDYTNIGGVCIPQKYCYFGEQTGVDECTCHEGYAGSDCRECAPYYIPLSTPQGNRCFYNLSCDSSKHLHQETNSCVCDAEYPVEYSGACYADLHCGENAEQHGDTCVCKPEYEDQGGECVLKPCPANQYRSGLQCINCPEHSTSPSGSTSIDACICETTYTRSGSHCVPALNGKIYQLGLENTASEYTIPEGTEIKIDKYLSEDDDPSIVQEGQSAIEIHDGASLINNGIITAPLTGNPREWGEGETDDDGFTAITSKVSSSKPKGLNYITNNGTINGVLDLSSTVFENSESGQINVDATAIDAYRTAISYNSAYSSKVDSLFINKGNINISDADGISGDDHTNIHNYGSINVINGTAVQYAKKVINKGTITRRKAETEKGYYFSNSAIDDVTELINHGIIDADGDAIYSENTVENYGKVEAGRTGIEGDYGACITNAGDVFSEDTGIELDSDSLLTNTDTGKINAPTAIFSSNSSVVNNGIINASLVGIEMANSTVTNNGTITVENDHSGLSANVYGIYSNLYMDEAENSDITNNGTINVVSTGTSTNSISNQIVAGIWANTGAEGSSVTINNTEGHVINVTASNEDVENSLDDYRGSNVYGIYAQGNNVTINNAGEINVTNNTHGKGEYIDSVFDTYGIYAKDGATITNSGIITINGGLEGHKDLIYPAPVEEELKSYSSGYTPIYVEKNAEILNAGTIISDTDMELTTGYKLSAGGITEAPSISGMVGLDQKLLMDNNATSFTLKDAFISDDVNHLGVNTGSALFDAKLLSTSDKTHDVTVKMKHFSDVVENKSLAKFLENNYAQANNTEFYNKLKSFGDLNSLNSSLNQLTGKDVLSRFNFEDMSMMRELNYDMNNNLFHSKENHLSIAGSVAPMAFKGDTGSNSRYSLFSQKHDNTSIGLGIAFTDTRSDDEKKSNNRHETMYQMIVPFGYKAGGLSMITSPRIGYARGEYDRTGFDNASYDGTIEKRVYGVMNEARYPFAVAGWSLEPSVEFNVLGYQQKGSEDGRQFSLSIPNQQTLSVEGGMGLYATKETELTKGKVNLSAGLAVYHEFADPYKLKLGMDGMDGSFEVRDENRSDNRAVARAGFNYTNDDNLEIYGSILSYIDKETRTKADAGLNWKF